MQTGQFQFGSMVDPEPELLMRRSNRNHFLGFKTVTVNEKMELELEPVPYMRQD